jgi:hypothetical protein
MHLPLPGQLERLVASGVWPFDYKASMSQNIRPIVSSDRVRKFAPEEDFIYLSYPPFRTIAHEVESASLAVAVEYWEKFGALRQIVPEMALIIGDFGLGSDAPIILNYAVNMADPPVFRLHWRPDNHTEWLLGATNFDEFVVILGLAGS